jgi:hypothetical protein
VVEEGVRRMSPEWIAVGVASGALAVGVVTLVVAVLILGSARRSEQVGEERLEMLREQRERLNLLNAERRMLLEELAEERKGRKEAAGEDHNAGQRARLEPPPQEGPSATSESGAEEEEVERVESRPGGEGAQEGSERPWWRRGLGP